MRSGKYLKRFKLTQMFYCAFKKHLMSIHLYSTFCIFKEFKIFFHFISTIISTNLVHSNRLNTFFQVKYRINYFIFSWHTVRVQSY